MERIKNKVKVDLITGFLGAGKTTFIKEYVAFCRTQHENIIMIENEFGKAGIDTEILASTQIPIAQLVGGCICCGQKVNFHDKILELAQQYERIIVEPSGVFTLEDFFDIMNSPPIQKRCEIGSIVLILDLKQMEDLNQHEERILYSQIAGAGIVVVSKLDKEKALKHKDQICESLNDLLKEYGNDRIIHQNEILCMKWDQMKKLNWQSIQRAGFYKNKVRLAKEDHSFLFQNITVKLTCDSVEKIEKMIRSVFEDEETGRIIRIKGYIKVQDEKWYEINCTEGHYQGELIHGERTAGINIIGEHLNRKRIQQLLHI